MLPKEAVPTAPKPRKAHPLAELVTDQIRSFEALAKHAAPADRREYMALAAVLKTGLPLALAKGMEV